MKKYLLVGFIFIYGFTYYKTPTTEWNTAAKTTIEKNFQSIGQKLRSLENILSLFTFLGGKLAINTNNLYIDTTTGKVGIGTSSPDYMLDIDNNTNGDKLRIKGSGYSGIFGADATGTYFYNDSAYRSMSFGVNSSRTNIVIDTTGNVGIGTGSPGYPFEVTGNAYFSANVSALSFTDRTPYPDTKEQAYKAVLSMHKKNKGGVDHELMDNFIVKTSTKTVYNKLKKKNEKVVEYGRDLSATVSCQNEVIKDLIKRIETLEKK